MRCRLSPRPSNLFLNSLNNLIVALKADTGASKNFIRDLDVSFLKQIQNIINGPIARLPNNSTIQAHKKGELPFSNHLSNKAKEALVFKDLKNASLLSIGQLCDDGCLALFHKKYLAVIKDNKVVLHGRRNYVDGLWDVPFDQSLLPSKDFLLHSAPNLYCMLLVFNSNKIF